MFQAFCKKLVLSDNISGYNLFRNNVFNYFTMFIAGAGWESNFGAHWGSAACAGIGLCESETGTRFKNSSFTGGRKDGLKFPYCATFEKAFSGGVICVAANLPTGAVGMCDTGRVCLPII